MHHFISANWNAWDRFYRANFMNSLSGFKSASLIGTISEGGIPNLAIFSNLVHIGADPVLIGFINRPVEAAPHTLANIQSTGVYTINHIHPAMVAQAHQTSARYPCGTDEFAMTGLTPVFEPSIAAPFVGESRIRYALRLQSVLPIELNRTCLVIGEVTDVYLNNEYLEQDGFIGADAADSVCSLGIDGYFSCSRINRYAYAKTDRPPQVLK